MDTKIMKAWLEFMPREESNLTGSVPQLSLTYFCINNK